MNLLPSTYSKEVRREKIIRLGFLFFSLVSAVLLVGIVFALPSYFTLMLSKADVFRRLEIEKQAFERQDIASFEKMITKINQKSALYINNETRRFDLSQLLVRMGETDDQEINLTNIDLRAEKNGSFYFVIRGNATTRDAFLSYLERLRNVPEFESIDSPISNLLREHDVQFEINAIIKKAFYFYATSS